MAIFNASLLLLTVNFVVTLSKQSADPQLGTVHTNNMGKPEGGWGSVVNYSVNDNSTTWHAKTSINSNWA